jgi:hypothetical protein
VVKWERSPARCGWSRKMDWDTFLSFVRWLAELDGTATQESVLHDPEVVEIMAKQRPLPYKPRIWGHTKLTNLIMTLIDVQTGHPMKRPEIPGEKLRDARNRHRLHETLTRIGVE